MSQRARIVDVKKGVVTIVLEGQGTKSEGLPLDSFEVGPYFDSTLKMRKGDTLELPYTLNISFYD
jgi:hypothetical protein